MGRLPWAANAACGRSCAAALLVGLFGFLDRLCQELTEGTTSRRCVPRSFEWHGWITTHADKCCQTPTADFNHCDVNYSVEIVPVDEQLVGACLWVKYSPSMTQTMQVYTVSAWYLMPEDFLGV